MSIAGEWKIQMVRDVPKIFNNRNVCCGLVYIVLHAIAWPSFVVWILIDIGLLFLLIIPWALRFIKKEPTRVDIMIPSSVNRRGGFNSAMSETLNSHVSEGSRIRSSSRRAKYDHEFSRYTPDQRDTRTPLPTISAIRNRLSYSTAEGSIRSTTPNPFSPSATNTLLEKNRMLRNPRSATHHTPNESRSSSVLHIARTNLPVAKEVCSPVVVKVAPLGTSPRINLKEAKPNPNTCSKEVVVNALKQITQKRKRVRPSYDSREADTSLSDNIPSVKRSRKEPATQQTIKRPWAKAAITNENFSKPPMPETKKHKASSDIAEGPPLLQESAVIPTSSPAAKTTETERVDDMEEISSTSSNKEVTSIQSTSDKENESLDNENKEEKITFGILKKLRTVYPSTKPSVDAMRRKYPILCSSGVAPRLGRQSLKLKYEDYVKDREDVYAKVKRVLEEVDEADLQKKKAENPPEPVNSGTVKSVTSAFLVSQLNTTTIAPVQSAEMTATNTLLSASSAVSACSTTAPPPNIVISNMSEALPTCGSTSGHKPTSTVPAITTANSTGKLSEVPSTVSSKNLTNPTFPSLVGTNTIKTSQMFSFPLPNALSTASTSNSQNKQPTLNFSMPVSSTLTTTSSSLAAGPGTTSSTSMSVSTGTTLGVSSSLGIGLSFPSSLGANLKLQLPKSATTTTTNTIQLQTSLPHATTNTMLISAGQTDTLFSANTAGTNINLSASNKTSSFPALATATTTNVVNLSGSLFTTSAGDMEVGTHPQINSMSGTTLGTNKSLFASTKQPNVTSVNNFTTGLFASATPASGVNGIIASSTSGTPFGNLFGNPQTTIINSAINTTTTTTPGQPFIFNIFQTSHTKTAPSNPTQSGSQMAQPSFSTKSTLFNQPQSSGFNFTTKNQASNNGFSFAAKNQASNSGFNFMANTANTAPNFSFNLQPSVGGADLSAPFTAPLGGFNLPSTATTSRRKTKTPTRNKPKRK